VFNLYTPFFKITKQKPETIIGQMEKSHLLYIIEGQRGEGKSCFLRYLTYNLYPTEVFTIILNTFGNVDYSDPNVLAQWIIGAILKALETYDQVPKGTRDFASQLMAKKVTVERGTEASFSAKVGGWLSIIPQVLRINAEVGGEIRDSAKTILEEKYYLADRVQCIDNIINNITNESGFSNVTLLLDGIDHMSPTDVVKFTQNNIPWLSQIDCSVALIALSEYRSSAGYDASLHNARSIKIPRIDSIEGLTIFLDKRLAAIDGKAKWSDVCEDKATQLLFNWYIAQNLMILPCILSCMH
jgi:hypothetical protein